MRDFPGGAMDRNLPVSAGDIKRGKSQSHPDHLFHNKDLSRFGRNYIEVGQYIDYIFPSFNIRFIALSDNVDTLDRNSTAMDLMPIMNFVSAPYGQNPKATDLPIFHQGALHPCNALFSFFRG